MDVEVWVFIDSMPFNVFMTIGVQIAIIFIPLMGALALARN